MISNLRKKVQNGLGHDARGMRDRGMCPPVSSGCSKVLKSFRIGIRNSKYYTMTPVNSHHGKTGQYKDSDWRQMDRRDGTNSLLREKGSKIGNFMTPCQQEPITRSIQLLCARATAFSQVGLFLDLPVFPRT